jgi:hypothetical protein
MVCIKLGQGTNQLRTLGHLPEWRFATSLQEALAPGVRVIVAGSASLRAYLDLLDPHLLHPLLIPNDFDIFVGSNRAGTTITTVYTAIFSFFVVNPDLSHEGLACRATPPYESFGPMRFLIDFCLHDPSDPGREPTKIQIIIMDARDERRVLSGQARWAMSVIQRFDISVCRVSNADPRHPGNFTFVRRQDSYDIVAGEFEFTFRQNCPLPICYKRLTKYLQRGFRLKKMNFESLGALVQGNNGEWSSQDAT